ncbi:OmpA/MotB family protein [Rhodophyticola porphyridii]|uniref:Chemotaxis protein MotB n=1 Tax=Rhodophyticola porphyridii TaxID=1852017 RepID=A0A3L9Y8B4_9RHOB|nr:flagellar motor protein MotB [Rhodophyticola porphyridii]RMA43518.1 chemotaxis protein MotB [Rhodophyticola porphyridii]
MSGQNDARPIIIKRKKVVGGDGHHGGAWKVAYADFVTAMMAFFLLMWLLNATTEQQRKGLADYFSPTVPIARISGGGDGAFGGESVFSERVEAQNGTGATDRRPTEGRQSMGMTGVGHTEEEEEAILAALEDALMAGGGDSMVTDLALRHVQTRLSDEGLIIEVFARPGAPLFDEETGAPADWLVALAGVMVELFDTVTNRVAIIGHVRSEPITVVEESRWMQSTAHAHRVRVLLEDAGLPATRLQRITGHADRRPVDDDPMSVRNDRIEIILLRNRI